MKFKRPGFLHILAIIIGLEFIGICFMPFVGLLPLNTTRIIFSIQYFCTGLFIIAFTLHKLKKKGDDK